MSGHYTYQLWYTVHVIGWAPHAFRMIKDGFPGLYMYHADHARHVVTTGQLQRNLSSGAIGGRRGRCSGCSLDAPLRTHRRAHGMGENRLRGLWRRATNNSSSNTTNTTTINTTHHRCHHRQNNRVAYDSYGLLLLLQHACRNPL